MRFLFFYQRVIGGVNTFCNARCDFRCNNFMRFTNEKGGCCGFSRTSAAR